MSDVVYRAGFDDSAVKRGFREIEGASKRSATEVRGGFESARGGVDKFLGAAAGFVTLERAISFTRSSMQDYVALNTIAAERTERFGTALDKLKFAIGRDYALLLTGAGGSTSDWIDAVIGGWQDVVNVTSDLMRGGDFGNAEGVADALGIEEAQALLGQALKTARQITAELDIARNRTLAGFFGGGGFAGGRLELEAELEEIQQRFEARIARINTISRLMQKGRAVGIDTQFDTGALVEQARRQKDLEEDAARRRLDRFHEGLRLESERFRERARNEREQLDLAEEGLRIDLLRRQGREKTADLMSLELRFEREIQRVRASGVADQDVRINRLRRLMGAALEAERSIQDETSATRRGGGAAAQGVDAVTTRQALGVGIERRSIETRQRNTRILEKVNGTLERLIQQQAGQGPNRVVII